MAQYICTVHLEINVPFDVNAENEELAKEVAKEMFHELSLDMFTDEGRCLKWNTPTTVTQIITKED